MKLALVGATGLVGKVMLKVLEEQKINVSQLFPVATKKSIGKKITFKNKEYTVVGIEEAIEQKPEFALFSAGGSTSLKYAPEFEKAGTTVIDNSSAWRMDSTKKLIVPEINFEQLTASDKIIANPNCSTIQLVMVLAPLHQKYKIKRLIISTYQSVSGSGIVALEQMQAERKGKITQKNAYPHKIDQNCLPHCDTFTDNDYTKEEMKLVNETHKILNDYSIKISATAVRIPVVGGHSESVNIEFENKPQISEIKKILSQTNGVVLQDEPQNNIYPMPINAHNRNEVFVGRIRKDLSCENAINLWIVADNLRKGAATNAVQILKRLI